LEIALKFWDELIQKIAILQQDNVTHYVTWLSSLEIPKICDGIETELLTLMRNKNLRYADYFTQTARENWKNGTHRDVPKNVNTIFDILETLKEISTVFKDLEAIDTSPNANRAYLIFQASSLLGKITPLYNRIQNLSHSVVDIQWLVQPILDQLFENFDAAKNKLQDKREQVEAIIDENTQALNAMFPSSYKGLDAITRVVVLMPNLLRELTELVASGDTKIDFNPASPKLLAIEQHFNEQLAGIQKNNTLKEAQAWSRLTRLLLSEASKILQEARPLTQESYLAARRALDKIRHEMLPSMQAELEQLEENVGFEPGAGVLVNPFKAQAESLFIGLAKHIDSLREISINTLKIENIVEKPATSIATSIVNFFIAMLGIPVLEIKSMLDIPESEATIVIEKGMEPFLDGLKMQDSGYNKALKHHRNKRLVQQQLIVDNSDKKSDSAVKFYDTFKKYAATRFTAFLGGAKEVKDLPSQAKAELIPLYKLIQPNVVRANSEIDIVVAEGLNYIQEEALAAQNISLPTNVLPSFMLTLANLFIQYGISVYSQEDIKEIKNTLDCINIAKTDIVQERNQAKFNIKAILSYDDEHRKNYLADEDYKAIYNQEAQKNQIQLDKLANEPLQVLGNQTEYKDLFGKIKDANLSKSIDKFLNARLLPWMSRMLGKRDFQAIFGELVPPLTINQIILPFTEFHKDTENVIFYKKLLNAFYYLKTCLVDLEKVADAGKASDWNYYGKLQIVLKILIPILTKGISAYFEIVKLIKSPLIAELNDEIVNELSFLKGAIPFLENEPAANQGIVVAHQPFNAYEAWVSAQENYQNRVYQRALPPQLPPQVIVEATELTSDIEVAKSSTTIETLANEIANKLNALTNYHNEKTLDSPRKTQAQLEAESIKLVDRFFSQLTKQINKEFKDNQATNKKWVEHLKEISIDFKKVDKLLPNKGNLLTNIKNMVSAIDKIAPIIELTFKGNRHQLINHIKTFRTALGMEILSLVDDFEFHNGSNPGSLDNEWKISETFNAGFDNLVKFYPESKEKYEFWFDETLLDWRIKREKKRIDNILNINADKDREQAFITNELTNLERYAIEFKALHADDPVRIEKIKQFYHSYNVLQPYLALIDHRQFTEISLLEIDDPMFQTPKAIEEITKEVLSHKAELNRNQVKKFADKQKIFVETRIKELNKYVIKLSNYSKISVWNEESIALAKKCCDTYQVLQPFLAKIDEDKFNQTNFFDNLHRPDQFIKAMKEVLNCENKIKESIDFKFINKLEIEKNRAEEKIRYLDKEQRNHQRLNAIKKSIALVIYNQSFAQLGDYTPSFVNTVSKRIYEKLNENEAILKGLIEVCHDPIELENRIKSLTTTLLDDHSTLEIWVRSWNALLNVKEFEQSSKHEYDKTKQMLPRQKTDYTIACKIPNAALKENVLYVEPGGGLHLMTVSSIWQLNDLPKDKQTLIRDTETDTFYIYGKDADNHWWALKQTTTMQYSSQMTLLPFSIMWINFEKSIQNMSRLCLIHSIFIKDYVKIRLLMKLASNH